GRAQNRRGRASGAGRGSVGGGAGCRRRGGGGAGGSGSLVNPHVIHQHGLGKTACSVGASRITSSHGHVQDKEKRRVENPGIAPGGRVGLDFIERVVHVKLNLVDRPFDREGVVGVFELLSSREAVISRAVVARTVDGS